MTVESIINKTGKEFSPYMGPLINHLPMAQWAVYKLSRESELVDEFTLKYLENARIDKSRKEYKGVNSLEEALGKRDLYEGTIDFLKKELLTKDIEELTTYILNKYPLGMSSGLFHTLIRVGYGVEGYMEKGALREELIRGLSYYVTAYRGARLFERGVPSKDIRKEMKSLSGDVHVKEILENHDRLGQRLKALYSDEIYLKKGFILKGDNHQKIRALLGLLIPLFYERPNIVILHCITSLHALIMLKEYYDDFGEAIDILTTCIITHLIATGIIDYPEMKENKTGFSWKCIIEKSLRSSDVHDIKLTYSAICLDKIYNIEQFKDISIKRIRHL